jgi:hypothetical protein
MAKNGFRTSTFHGGIMPFRTKSGIPPLNNQPETKLEPLAGRLKPLILIAFKTSPAPSAPNYQPLEGVNILVVELLFEQWRIYSGKLYSY